MYDPELTRRLLAQIAERAVYMQQIERSDYEDWVRRFEQDGVLDTDTVLFLFELRDRLDIRAGALTADDSAAIW